MEGIPDAVLQHIFSLLEPVDCGKASVVQRSWCRIIQGDDHLWRNFCRNDWLIEEADEPTFLDGQKLSSYKDLYAKYFLEFSRYSPIFKRMKMLLNTLESWLMENIPEIYSTLRDGVSESDLDNAEEKIGVLFPLSFRLFYRLCDGQNVTLGSHSTSGIFGGYSFYNHQVSVHMLSLEKILALSSSYSSPQKIAFAFGPRMSKFHFLDAENGLVYSTSSEYISQCVPGPVDESGDSTGRLSGDAFLRWLEEYCSRLQSGMYCVRKVSPTKREISLFPELHPSCTVAVTRGIQIRCSSVFVPEASEMGEDNRVKFLFAYSVRIRLLKNSWHRKVQLISRHWIIWEGNEIVSQVRGDGVIGEFPILEEGGPEFVYQSCTRSEVAGQMEGTFQFIPGSTRQSEGEIFDAQISLFPVAVPSFVY